VSRKRRNDHRSPEVGVDGHSNGSGPGRLLDVLPAGAVPPNPSEMLESNAMQRALAWARQRYELVVVDSAPLSVVLDSIPLLTRVDGVIVVSRLGHSRCDAAQDSESSSRT
jgi:Mrp family chromosome partitioning ATPase